MISDCTLLSCECFAYSSRLRRPTRFTLCVPSPSAGPALGFGIVCILVGRLRRITRTIARLVGSADAALAATYQIPPTEIPNLCRAREFPLVSGRFRSARLDTDAPGSKRGSGSDGLPSTPWTEASLRPAGVRHCPVHHGLPRGSGIDAPLTAGGVVSPVAAGPPQARRDPGAP